MATPSYSPGYFYQWLKCPYQTLEHRAGNVVPGVESELKFTQILLHMFSRNTAMSTQNTVFEVCPEALDGVGMRFSVYPLVNRVVHGLVRIAHALERAVRRPLVGAHQRAFFHVLFDVREKGLVSRVLDYSRDDVPAALDHAEDNGLFRLGAGPSRAMRIVHGDKLLVARPTADKGFVDRKSVV